MSLIGKLSQMMKSEKPDVNVTGMEGKPVSPSFILTEDEYNIAGAITGKIQYNYDRKTGVVSVTVNDFDPLVCALIVDTVSNKLQNFIMDYRTKKARNDLAYAQRIYNNTKAEYEESNERYVAAVDANWDIVNETAKARLEALANDKTLKYQTFSAAAQKLEAAKAKLQEATPVITVLQGASVPQKPAGPKRVLITLLLIFIVCFGCSVYIIAQNKKELYRG
jgi:capsule polysaccharide export protein KpsE/RkpR